MSDELRDLEYGNIIFILNNIACDTQLDVENIEIIKDYVTFLYNKIKNFYDVGIFDDIK